MDYDDDDVHDGDKEHEWDVKSRAFKSRIESDKTSWVHLFTLPLENATRRSLTGYCDGDDKDVDDIEDVDDGDVAIMISQSIVILSFFHQGEAGRTA